MTKKPANAYKHTRVSYIINTVGLLPVSATPVTIFREGHYKGHITKDFEPMHEC
jgi:hypothetical protein